MAKIYYIKIKILKLKINLSKEIERVTLLDSLENIVYLIIFKGHRVFE